MFAWKITGSLPVGCQVLYLRNADRNNVWLEDNGLVEAKESQIVLECFGVKLLVGDHDGNFPVLIKKIMSLIIIIKIEN